MVKKILDKTKKMVWPVINSYLKDPMYPAQFKIPAKFKKEVNFYWKINKDYPERKGKYLRPTLVRLMAEALNYRSEKTIKLAAAMQMSEEWILISDDIEDKSEERRNKPTLHKLHGIELALNASDALETVMWKMISDLNSPALTNEFYSILMRTILGQGVEQIWINKRKKLNVEEYFFIADSKSAYYSIAGPLRLGAILSGVKNKQLNSVTQFGLHLGRSFQLIDDILDFKQDKKEGKVTLANTKGVEFSRSLAQKEKDQAESIFNHKLKFLKNTKAIEEIKEISDFIINRSY